MRGYAGHSLICAQNVEGEHAEVNSAQQIETQRGMRFSPGDLDGRRVGVGCKEGRLHRDIWGKSLR